MPARLNYLCLLCPNYYDETTDSGDATEFDTVKEALTHVIEHHRIEEGWLRQLEVIPSLAIDIGSREIRVHFWQLPKGGAQVIQTYHDHQPGEIFGDASTTQ